MYRILTLGILAATLAACTANQTPRSQSAAAFGRTCFNASTVNSFHAVDRDTVIVTVGANRNYLLDVLGTCPDINWSLRVGLRSTGGSSWVCQGQDAEFLVPSPGRGFDRCPVLGVRAISPEEARALRSR
jgi:hypothetical protein